MSPTLALDLLTAAYNNGTPLSVDWEESIMNVRFVAMSLMAVLGVSASASETTRFAYDALGRVVAADKRSTTIKGSRTQYWFDAASNRSSVLTSTGQYKGVSLPRGSTLSIGDGILSSDEKYLLVLQTDGNLVLYNEQARAGWSTATSNRGVARANMQTDGNFVLYTANNQPIWSTGTYGTGADSVAVQTDGRVAVKSGATTLWQAEFR